jgi:hypothetical protein
MGWATPPTGLFVVKILLAVAGLNSSSGFGFLQWLQAVIKSFSIFSKCIVTQDQFQLSAL